MHLTEDMWERRLAEDGPVVEQILVAMHDSPVAFVQRFCHLLNKVVLLGNRYLLHR